MAVVQTYIYEVIFTYHYRLKEDLLLRWQSTVQWWFMRLKRNKKRSKVPLKVSLQGHLNIRLNWNRYCNTTFLYIITVCVINIIISCTYVLLYVLHVLFSVLIIVHNIKVMYLVYFWQWTTCRHLFLVKFISTSSKYLYTYFSYFIRQTSCVNNFFILHSR